VQSIALMVTDNYEDEDLRKTFLDLIMQLHVEQPLKTPFVAAVILVANTQKSELVDEVLAKLVESTQDKISRGEWRDVKLHLKLLACLQSVLEGDGLFPVLDDLFSRAADLQTTSSEDVRELTNGLVEDTQGILFSIC
jgi:nuclear cap-binding protein subunit 1